MSRYVILHRSAARKIGITKRGSTAFKIALEMLLFDEFDYRRFIGRVDRHACKAIGQPARRTGGALGAVIGHDDVFEQSPALDGPRRR